MRCGMCRKDHEGPLKICAGCREKAKIRYRRYYAANKATILKKLSDKRLEPEGRLKHRANQAKYRANMTELAQEVGLSLHKYELAVMGWRGMNKCQN